ncbi:MULTISPECIES: hypothetical protein [Streptomyces]|uniref:hypothetical protein n=1 Tax=Streptomyces TaxID=1883 RepID=UPI001031296D|nr:MULTISPECIES: hypothetical protein [Streptomyces]
MRRRCAPRPAGAPALALTLTLAAGLLLGGCGSDVDSGDPGGGREPATAPESALEGFAGVWSVPAADGDRDGHEGREGATLTVLEPSGADAAVVQYVPSPLGYETYACPFGRLTMGEASPEIALQCTDAGSGPGALLNRTAFPTLGDGGDSLRLVWDDGTKEEFRRLRP